MEITVIRHGETIDNRAKICQGHSDGRLSELGIAQARALGESLSNQSFDHVISSDLKRAVDTSRLIFGEDAEIKEDSRLRERGLAALQGRELDPSINYCAHIDGCESMEEFFGRVRDMLAEIKSCYAAQKVALVTHGLTIRVIASICEQTPLEQTSVVDNCSLNKFIIP